MSLTRYGAGITNISGSMSGNTFSHGKGGSFNRARTKPCNPNSPAQIKARSALTAIQQRWLNILTSSQRAGWERYGLTLQMKNKIGEAHFLPGSKQHLRTNLPLFMIGAAPKDEPPVQIGFPAKDPTLAYDITPPGTVKNNPVITRDLFYEGSFFSFIHLGGHYYYRQTHRRTANANGLMGRTDCYPLDSGFYGIVRPGKAQDYSRRYAQSMAWNSDPANGWPLYYKSTIGVWLEWKIPSGHNRIHFIARTRSTYGTLTVSLGTTSGGTDLNSELLTTSINLATAGPDNDIKELIIATDANTPGEKYLRFTIATAFSCYLVGIHSFDTDGIADPNETLPADGLWLGNDLIDTVAGWLPTYTITSNMNAYLANPQSSVELTINWKPVGSPAKKWTSIGAAHYGAGAAQFIPGVVMFLSVGGISQGNMNQTITLPRGKLFQDPDIFTRVVGNGDFNEDGDILDAVDCMQADVITNITSAGFTFDVSIHWLADCECGYVYTPRIKLPNSSEGDAIINDITYHFKGDGICDYEILSATNIKIYPDGLFFSEEMNVDYVCARIFEGGAATETQHYCQVDTSVLTGGSFPLLGTNWLNLTSSLSIHHYPNCVTVYFDRFMDWCSESGAYLIIASTKPKKITINSCSGPFIYAGIVSGSAVTPPNSPFDILLPFTPSINQKLFLKSEIILADGRLTQSMLHSLSVS